MIQVYTDGSCLGNPGKGGWGVIVLWEDGGETQLWGNSKYTTNNEMEMTAIYNSLLELQKNNINDVEIYTDSNYVKQGITNWIKKWRTNGYMTATNKPIKNRELWIAIDEEQSKFYTINWNHVYAHKGNEHNERVDKIARESAEAVE